MTRREFHFTDGSSNKFWAIELNGTGFTVHFGRVGTAGQAQEKSFDSEDKARKEHDKLIAEKTKKGYLERHSGSVAGPAPAPIKRVSEPKPAPAAAAVASHAASVQLETSVPAAQAAPRPPVSAPAAIALERRVRLNPEDRAMISWRWERLPQPPLKPFDYEACVKVAKTWYSTYGCIVRHEAEFPPRMTREEAWFWILVHSAGTGERNRWSHGFDNRRMDSPEKWEALVRSSTAKLEPPAEPSRNPLVKQALEEAGSQHQLFAPLSAMFGPIELAEHFIEAELARISRTPPNTYHSHPSFGAAGAFGDGILAHLSAEERHAFREAMVRRFRAEADPMCPAAQLALGLLSLVSGGEELASFLAGVTLPLAQDTSGRLLTCLSLRTLAGLPDEAAFVRETERLGIALLPPDTYSNRTGLLQVRLWLAATEWRQTGFVVKALVQGTSKNETARMGRLLALVEAPEMAPGMIEVQLHSKAPALAAEWFAAHPLHTAVGLAPLAMGSGRQAEAARDVLLHLRRSGQTSVLEAALPHLADPVRAWLEREIIAFTEESLPEARSADLPDPLAKALALVKPGKLPTWLLPTALPPIKINGMRLAPPETARVIAQLREAVLGNKADSAPAIALMKLEADKASLDTFAWKLFEQWLAFGAPAKDKWAMGAVGHFGSDRSVLRLTPMIREWPGESQHQRAVFGLEVLRSIGTDTALMSLNGIAQKLKFQALKEKAKLMMEAIARTRGLTGEQLADRIVPDCGLDEKGGRIFDFGPRQFRFVLGPEMKPLVRDAAGKLRPDLPAPNNSDDREKAEPAVAEWKLLKKTLREVLKIQAERLEDAMITGRRWTPEEFETLLLRHPLMVNLARQLVFGSYASEAEPHLTFRVTEDQTLADCHDDPCELPHVGTIGVVHPAHLDEATASAWGQVLSDYEIISPFQQLGREICRPEPDDLDQTEITRFKGPKIPGIVVYGILEKCHWVRDTPADAGGFMQHSKFFPAANITAFIQYSGMGIGYYEEPQEIESVYFVPGHIKPDWWGQHDNKLRIREVSPVMISEVLRIVRAIVSKAE